MQARQFNFFGEESKPRQHCQVYLQDGALAVQTPFDYQMVEAIKSLPAGTRRYAPRQRIWLIDVSYGTMIQRWIAQFFGETISLPEVETKTSIPKEHIIKVYYLTRTKDRGNDERSALGLNDNNEWMYVFNESVLKRWFAVDFQDPAQARTLYGVLGISKNAENGAIRSAYRRLALQWHPDQCKETNAHEVFLKIQQAYEVLNNPEKRRRYDVGLNMEKRIGKNQAPIQTSSFYRTPLRCGLMIVKGRQGIGMLNVEEILQWSDITNPMGQTLVSSWPFGAKEPYLSWI